MIDSVGLRCQPLRRPHLRRIQLHHTVFNVRERPDMCIQLIQLPACRLHRIRRLLRGRHPSLHLGGGHITHRQQIGKVTQLLLIWCFAIFLVILLIPRRIIRHTDPASIRTVLENIHPIAHPARERIQRRMQQRIALRRKHIIEHPPAMRGAIGILRNRRNRHLTIRIAAQLLLLIRVHRRLRKPRIHNRMHSLCPRPHRILLRLLHRIRQRPCIHLHPRNRIRLRRERHRLQQSRRSRRLRILFYGNIEQPLPRNRQRELLIRNPRRAGNRFQILSPLLLLQRRHRIHIRRLKTRPLHLRADDLLLHIGRRLLQLCRRGHLLQPIQHHRPRQRMLHLHLLTRLRRRKPTGMPQRRPRRAERRSQTEPHPRRKRLHRPNQRPDRHIPRRDRPIRRTAICGINNLIVNQIIGERLRPLLE